MKKLYLLLLTTFVVVGAYSQTPWQKNLPKTKSKKELTFADYQKAFYDYWKPYNVDKGFYVKDGKRVKAAGWKQFKRWEWNMEGQIDVATKKFPEKSAQQVYTEFIKNSKRTKGLKAAGWSMVGPNSSDGGYYGVGRINCIEFHPTDNDTYWVGAPAGGLWQTTDNGLNWTCLTDNNDVLGVSDIVIPSDFETSHTIYIATGDRDAGDNRSVGVLKSIDGGATWNTTGLSYILANNRRVNRLLLDPNDDNTIIAAVSNGVYKTTDGGTTWSTQLSANSFIDMEYKPGDFNTLYGATSNGKIFVSENGGSTWTSAFSDSNADRIELAVTPANSTIVYALATGGDNGLYGVYKSTNSGASFAQVYNGTSKNLLGWDVGGNDEGGQGWYDLSLAVSPSDANTVLVGGVNTWRSVTGGTNWAIVNHWSGSGGIQTVHADKHMLRFRSNGDLFECNDGGVYISTDNGSSWMDKTNGMVISQMYKLGLSKTISGEVIAGLQDNGTKLISGGTWYDVKGGDGMECLIDYSDVNIQYGTYVNGQISRTINHWATATAIEPSGAGNGAWVTPYIIDPNDPATLYAGYSNVWKTNDRGDNWTEISSMNTSQKIRSMAISESNTSLLFVADYETIWKTTNGGTSWTDVTNNLPTGSAYIRYIAIKNDDENTVWVAMSGYNEHAVYQTTNGGVSWTNVSTGLPEIPAYTVVQNKQSTGEVQLYVGTELGVYFKAGTNDWIEFNTGLPNVKIGELEIYYNPVPSESKLYAATYGRGLWETLVETPITTVASVITEEVTNLDISSATIGGNVADEGATSVTERGIVWNLSSSPTTSDTKIVDAGTGVGTFTTSLDGLAAATTYFAKAYAINSYGTAYGNEQSFTTYCNGPGSQATNLTATAVNDNDVTLTWTSGGDYVIVIAKEGSEVDTDPFRGTVYAANSNFTLGENIGTNCIAVYAGTEETVTITGLNEGTSYYFAIYKYIDAEKCYNTSSPATGTVVTIGLCTALGNAAGNGAEYIDGVILKDISNLGSGSNGYEDNKHLYTALAIGETYVLTINNGYYWAGDDLGVWIDFDDNDSFEDEGENLICTSNDGADGNYNLTIPADAAIGEHTMRIRMKDLGDGCGSPCGITEFGEVEDYTVIIKEQVTFVEKLPEEMKLKISPNPSNGRFVIESGYPDRYLNISVKDLSGRIIFKDEFTGKRNELDLSNQPRGVYLMDVRSEGEISVLKLILR